MDVTRLGIIAAKVIETPSFLKELKEYDLEDLLNYCKWMDSFIERLSQDTNPPFKKPDYSWASKENAHLRELVTGEIMRRNKVEEPAIPANKRLTWNGQKNTLADVFFQLKTLFNDKGQPYLDASNEVLAQFLKENFECFKDTSINTIQNYFEMPEKRPAKKSKDKIHLKRGGE